MLSNKNAVIVKQKGIKVNDTSTSNWIGFDLGGTKMLALVLDKKLGIIGRERKKTKSQNLSSNTVDRIIKTIHTAIEKCGASHTAIAGIGIGVPGALDLNKGIVLDAPNLGWKKMPLKELLETEFSCPVSLINDADAGVYGEYRIGSARQSRCVLGIFPGTGIGGGCVYQGELITSKNGSCMEIGHIPAIADGNKCGCGRFGCLETVAGRLAISASAAMAVFRGEAPYLQKVSGTDLSNIKSGALADSIKAGDKSIELIVTHAATMLGKTAAGIVNILAPDKILLGGGLVEAMPELYKSVVERAIKSHVMPVFENSFEVVVAKLGDDAIALGAALWAQHKLARQHK